VKYILFFVSLLAINISGCSNSAPIALGNGIVVTVGRQKITLNEFKQRLNNFASENGMKPGRISKNLVMANLNNLINTMLLLKEAGKEGITATTKEINNEYNRLKQGYTDKQFNKIFIEKLINRNLWFKKLKERIIIKKLLTKHFSNVSVSKAEIKAYYDTHLENFYAHEMIKAKHMDFSSEQAARRAFDAINGGQDFTKAAKTYSITRGASFRGEMGFLSAADLPGELAGILFSLPVGKTSGIIKTQFGYQIFLVEKKIPSHEKSLNEVRNNIITILHNKKINSNFKKWLKILNKQEVVHISYELLRRAGLI